MYVLSKSLDINSLTFQLWRSEGINTGINGLATNSFMQLASCILADPLIHLSAWTT